MRDGPDDRTDSRKHHRDASAPPARSIPGESKASRASELSGISGISGTSGTSGASGGGATPGLQPQNRQRENLRRFSLCCWSGKQDSHSRCARAVREFWQTPPAPGRGVLRSHEPSPSCTGIQNKKGRTFWILPSCFGAENGTRTRARAVPRTLADTPGPWKGRFEVAGAESLMHRHTKQKGKNLLDSSLLFWSGKRISDPSIFLVHNQRIT